MKKVKKIAAQGDMIVRRVESLPKGLAEVEQENGAFICAHSETGHHHVAVGASEFHVADDGMLAYLVAKGPVKIEHKRPWDTHEALELFYDGGGEEVIWEIRRQREYIPEGWRRVED